MTIFKFVNLLEDTTSSYDTGLYFEKFVKTLLESSGYSDIEMRRKQNSLEYDIIARQTLDKNQEVIGEAKAQKRKIDGNTLSSFMGKMLPFWQKNKNTLGLFISLSELTPDANDYFREVKTKNRVVVYSGEKLLDILGKNAGFKTLDQIKATAELETNLKPSETFLCLSDREFIYVQLLIPKDKTLPQYFTLYSKEGIRLDEFELASNLKQKIDELQHLGIYGSTTLDVDLQDSSLVEILRVKRGPVIQPGSGWFDYKLPAPPECFIGREKKISDFLQFLSEYQSERTNITILQVLSKSGVGKSSFLLKIKSITDKKDCLSLLIDARDIQNSIDLIAFTQYAVKEFKTKLNLEFSLPVCQKECADFFLNANETLNKIRKNGIIYLDQFEGLFSKPENFNQLFDFFYEIARNCDRFILVVGRKSDFLTTFDDSLSISFEKLHNLSRSIFLPDFNKKEALELIEKLEDDYKEKVKKNLVQQVLELSNGFPWLHKRICYHLWKLHDSGQSQDEIIQSGLRIEDLFDEELENLDELDKEFLKNLINYLPASIFDLHEKLRDYPDFRNRLKKLQDLRLIGLTGNTLDTYNDFFKEYIKTGRIPIRTRYILKRSPSSLLKWFGLIIEKNYSSMEEILKNERIKRGSFLNIIRDMRIVGLVDYKTGIIIPSSDAEISFQEGLIKDFLKAQLFHNYLIIDTLKFLSSKMTGKRNDLVDFLKKDFPFVEATDKTWKTYSQILIDWLIFCKFDEVLQFDLTSNKIRKRSERMQFFPAYTVTKTLEILEKLTNGQELSKNNLLGEEKTDRAITDSTALGLMKRGVNGYFLTKTGKKLLESNQKDREILIRNLLISWVNIRDFLALLKYKSKVDPRVLFKDYIENLNLNWTEETRDLLFRMLRDWLKYARLVYSAKKKGRIYHHDTMKSLDAFF